MLDRSGEQVFVATASQLLGGADAAVVGKFAVAGDDARIGVFHEIHQVRDVVEKLIDRAGGVDGGKPGAKVHDGEKIQLLVHSIQADGAKKR